MVKKVEDEQMKWTKAMQMGIYGIWVPVVLEVAGMVTGIMAHASQTRALVSPVEFLEPTL